MRLLRTHPDVPPCGECPAGQGEPCAESCPIRQRLRARRAAGIDFTRTAEGERRHG
jgi:hypothetical protein